MKTSLKLGFAALLALQLACSPGNGQSGSELLCNQGAVGDQRCADMLGHGHVCASQGVCAPASSPPDAGAVEDGTLEIVDSDPQDASIGPNFNATRVVRITFSQAIDPATVDAVTLTGNGVELVAPPAIAEDDSAALTLSLPPSFAETTDYALTFGTGLRTVTGDGLPAAVTLQWRLTAPHLIPDAGL